jgi:hypothetical protein
MAIDILHIITGFFNSILDGIDNTCFGLVFLILLTSFLPENLLKLSDNLFIRYGIFAWLIWGLYNYDHLQLLLLVVFIGLLFAERNRVKIEKARDKFDEIIQADTPAQMTVEEEGEPQSIVPVVPFDDPPQDDIYTFMPTGSAGTDAFDGGMTTKHPLPTVLLGEKMARVYLNDGLALGKDAGGSGKTVCNQP